MDEQDFPRVLVISGTPFGRTTGTGITLSNLFEGWPKDRLAQIYTQDDEPADDVCTRYLRLPVTSAPVELLLRHLLTKRGLTRVQVTSASATLPTATARSAAVARLYSEMRAGADVSVFRVPHRLHDWVGQFRPDVVYSVLGSVRMMRLSAEVAQAADRPLVPHFTDDWPSTLYTGGQLFGLARRSVDANLRKVLRFSPLGMGISQAMADEYESRYGRPFSVFGNSVDESGFAAAGSARPASVPDDSPSHPVRLVYVGGLHLDRWQPLIDIASALGSVDPRARLVIHAPDADLETFGDVLTACPGVQLAGSVSSDQVPGILAAADILVHIESFDDAHRRYTRLSLSTKIPQYMAAGRAILAYGPGEVASMKHIEAVRAGVVVGQEDPQALAAAVTKLTTDAAARNELGNNGYWFARRHHAKDLVAARFVDFLRSAGQPRQTAQPTGPDQRASS